jgi:HTH-type transcriptional regulator / antitoxin HigA
MMRTFCQLNYAIPPGVSLRETLETIGMTQAELAKRAGRPQKTINEIIAGKAAITAETALQLERALGIPASFWNNLERNYQETLVHFLSSLCKREEGRDLC